MIVAGALLGVVNTVLTEAVMRVAPVERPIASSAYSFVRFAGGAVAPWLAGKLAEWVSPATPFFVGAVAVTSRCSACSPAGATFPTTTRASRSCASHAT